MDKDTSTWPGTDSSQASGMQTKSFPKISPKTPKADPKLIFPKKLSKKGRGAPHGQLLLLVVGAPTDGAQVEPLLISCARPICGKRQKWQDNERSTIRNN